MAFYYISFSLTSVKNIIKYIRHYNMVGLFERDGDRWKRLEMKATFCGDHVRLIRAALLLVGACETEYAKVNLMVGL